ncbi:MAG: AAA family ATPase [Weeksellaceae bacterium]
MSGIFDFIRKQSPNATQDPQQAGSAAPAANPASDVPQPIVVETQTVAPQPQSYNGIGTPPSGQSYNGIGQTPGGGTPYNGIGAPPVAAAPVEPAIVVPVEQPKIVTAPSAPPANQAPISTSQNNSPQNNNQSKPVQNSGDNRQQNNNQNQNNSQNNQQKQFSKNAPQQNNNQQKNSQSGNTTKPPAALNSNLSNQKRNTLDVMTHLTQRSNKVFMEANNKAKDMKNMYVDSEHLLHGLISDGEIYKLLVELKAQPQLVQQELAKNYKKESSPTPPQIAPRVKQIVENSLIVARKLGYEFISPEHLLLALFEEGEGLGSRILVKMGIKKEDLNKKITGKAEGIAAATGQEAAKQKQKSALEQYTIDLTAKAAANELDPVVERSEVIERVVHILSRRIKNNPALIGEPGVGKTAVVEGLAERIVAKQVPETLLGKRILVLDLTSVIAGASHRGEFEERMKNIVDELKESKGQVIMFIDEMHTMIGAGGGGDGALDASNFIKPALARGEVQLIGATTITEYRKYIEKDAALERRFQTVVVPEPSVEAAIKMLKATRDKYESFHKVKIPDAVIDLAVKLSKRYIGDRFLPDKAFDLMDEASAAVRLPLISLPEEIKSIEDRISQLKQEVAEYEKSGEKVKARINRSKIDDIQGSLNAKKDEYNAKKSQQTTEVSEEIVKDIIAKRTGIQISKISATEGDKLVNLEETIHKRMIGQERPVLSVAQAVRRGRAGLKATNRPIGSFVFLGPSGVGKTELAKSVAEVLFDDEDAVIRFDMTEYMERHEVAKLLGPPPGYVGYEEGGKLTEAVRRKPYSLVLFDEVEKAHPDIFNILLQILDDGRLTDNKGRTISFKNTVVICTSNIGTKMIQDELMKSGQSEVTEPTMIATYVFTPRGREIMTVGNKYFERDGGVTSEVITQTLQQTENKAADSKPASSTWQNHLISDYFAGQKIEGKVDTQPTDAEKAEAAGFEKDPNAEPTKETTEVDTDNKKLGFPAFGYDTHAISSQGKEIVTKGNAVYMRTATTAKVWTVTNLIEYFKDHMVINALPDAPDEQLPTIRLKTHAFTPDDKEIMTFKDRYWRRKTDTTDWETGTLKDYFTDQTVDGGAFPITHWDLHTFSPSGREIVIVGNDIWFHEAGQTAWKKQTLEAYFGADFPVVKEVDAQRQVEDQTDVKKYQIIKDKVMVELLKFFRPELVNRFDEVIVFEPLKFSHMLQIAKLQLKGLTKLLEEQEMGFMATDAAIKEIVRSGFDPIYGARPLRRAIQKLIENPISELIIAKKVKAGDAIIADFDGEEFIFNVESIQKKAGSSTEADKKMTHSKFFCEKCAKKFETDVISTATTVCTNCASKQVQKVESDETQTIKDETQKTEATDTKAEEVKSAEPVTPTVVPQEKMQPLGTNTPQPAETPISYVPAEPQTQAPANTPDLGIVPPTGIPDQSQAVGTV